MSTTAKDWFQLLTVEARKAKLDHLDVLIDCTTLPAQLLPPLLELTPAPASAWLFEQTLEHEVARFGPLLLRIELTHEQQCAGLLALLDAVHHDFCVLALTSRWPFDALAAHLRGATRACWNQNTCSGVLRYYDTRLFKSFCEQLDPPQLKLFHAPVSRWHWIDHDNKAAALSGFDTRPGDQPAQTGMSLSNEQVLHLQAVSAALRWFKEHAKTPHEHGFTSREAMIRCLIEIHLDISRQKLEKHEHEDFIATALSTHLPITSTWHKAHS